METHFSLSSDGTAVYGAELARHVERDFELDGQQFFGIEGCRQNRPSLEELDPRRVLLERAGSTAEKTPPCPLCESGGTQGWQPKETRPNCRTTTPRSRGVGTPRVTVPLTTSSRTVGQWDTVTGQWRASRDLGAAPPQQKPTRRASGVVREPLPQRGGDPSVLCS